LVTRKTVRPELPEACPERLPKCFDRLTCDDDGLIILFKVRVRPLKAMNMLHAKMGEMLQQMSK
jgi:hypothetical protein